VALWWDFFKVALWWDFFCGEFRWGCGELRWDLVNKGEIKVGLSYGGVR